MRRTSASTRPRRRRCTRVLGRRHLQIDERVGGDTDVDEARRRLADERLHAASRSASRPRRPPTVYALMAGLSNTNPNLAYLVNGFYRSDRRRHDVDEHPVARQRQYRHPGLLQPERRRRSDDAGHRVSQRDLAVEGVAHPAGAWTHHERRRHDSTPTTTRCAFQPGNHLVVYAGSDGGIYRSADGGVTWSDSINKGPCITQFEFIDQHPTSDAVVFGGTQDNGTEQFRNSPVFYHSDDGDGGTPHRSQPAEQRDQHLLRPEPEAIDASAEVRHVARREHRPHAGTPFSIRRWRCDQTNPNNMAVGTTDHQPRQRAGHGRMADEGDAAGHCRPRSRRSTTSTRT